MNRFMKLLALSFVSLLCLSPTARAQEPIDVLRYDAQVEPDIVGKSVSGRVLIRFVARVDDLAAAEFDCGDLIIDAAREGGEAREYVRRGRRVEVRLPRPAQRGETREVEIAYHGVPRYGVSFFPEQRQVYTVFSTSRWMPCIDAPDDRAALRLALVLPADLAVVANGRRLARRPLPGGKVAHEWSQDAPVPTYTFGFAAAPFREVAGRAGRVRLRHLAAGFADGEVHRVFRDTAGMIRFYEARAGVAYPGGTYTQVLAAGAVEQEMSGFTVMRDSYGGEVLADGSAVWLGAHELAHQWWGNMVTCRDWTHFWLNEGVATFMAAAYFEHRFGRAAYLREIEWSRLRYERVRAAGKDRSLVFPDWSRPTKEDRTLVYHKGAYVLHLLRAEMAERAFWAGVRGYTRGHFGASVTTPDFQIAMERAAGRSLAGFFAEHVYLTRR